VFGICEPDLKIGQEGSAVIHPASRFYAGGGREGGCREIWGDLGIDDMYAERGWGGGHGRRNGARQIVARARRGARESKDEVQVEAGESERERETEREKEGGGG
jgi:hypothetical protein